MRKTLIFFLMFVAAWDLAAQNKLQLIPAQPEPGKKLTIRYDPAAPGAALPGDSKTIEMVFTYSNFYEYPWRIPMEKKGNIWEYSMIVPRYAVFASFYLEANGKKDQPAADKHFEIPVFKNGQRVENGYLYEQYSLTAQMGKKPELADAQAALLKKELQTFPNNYEAKLRLLSLQMSTANDEDKNKLREQARKIIADKFYEDPGRNGFLNKTTMGYLIIGDNSRLDSIRKVVRQDYPESEAGYAMRIAEIAREEDSTEMAKKMHLLLRNENAGNKRYFSAAHDRLFRHYSNLKNEEKALFHLDNINKDFTPYTPEILKEQAELLLENELALDRALKLAQHALVLSDTFEVGLTRHFPETGHIPSFVSREERAKSTATSAALMKSIIARIQHKLAFEEAATQNMAEALNLSTEDEVLVNAGKFYEATKNYPQAVDVYRTIMMRSADDSSTFAKLRKAHQMMGGTETQWKQEEEKLLAHWRSEMFAELNKEIINTDAPDFLPALVDLRGKAVDKNIMRNKVTVINFWATWCVPCMKEMPYMQNAYNLYRDNKKVQFMIINSGANNTIDDARGWNGNKIYSFPVFYNNDRTIGTKFGFNVIPATYILDSNGKVRFKIIGFEGPAIQRKVELAVEMLLKS